MKIVVLGGGLSPERDVSKKSASLIANALLSKGHEVALIDLYDGIENDDPVESFFRTGTDELFSYDIPEEEPDLDKVIADHGGRKEWLGPRVIEICKTADCVFLGLHGANGENGKTQAVLEAYDIRYTGCGYTGCVLAMDKGLSKALVAGEGYKTSKWFTIRDEDITYEEVVDRLGLPFVVKPIGCGSSCGVSIVHSKDEFDNAMNYAEKYERHLIIEQYIKGREITVSILDGKALPITEIIPHEGFYDYKNKYQAGLTTHVCPASFTEEETARAKKIAEEEFHILRMTAYGRIDMIYDGTDFWFIEANNLPGMTNTSLLPEAAAQTGITYEDLCERIAIAAGRRHA
ncbi:MAG: D-alanine--D-alanine ligase [Clostridiales bacterium]|nr:D-alanine--D-alanine ligase [Clostridiales bacterium]MBP3811222.1 D-alanine--D-alanine ligase [Clostridiales bacterium]